MNAAELSACTFPVRADGELHAPLLVVRVSMTGELQFSVPIDERGAERLIFELRPGQAGALLNWLLRHANIEYPKEDQ